MEYFIVYNVQTTDNVPKIQIFYTKNYLFPLYTTLVVFQRVSQKFEVIINIFEKLIQAS